MRADEFLLDPDVVFLNHGSFGACPRPVFERYQALQREVERQPIEFLDRRLPERLAEARAALAAYVGAAPDTEQTRVVFVSHVTSETAVILPVRAICERARSLGILTLVDGAHVPGHVALDLETLGADVYAGNCHKWLGAPKGAGFLHVHAELQERVQPLITGWGFGPDATFVTRHERQGTRDPSAYLSVPAAIEWQEAHDTRAAGHALAVEAQQRLTALTGLAPISNQDRIGRMVSVRIPAGDPDALQRRLLDEHRIEVPVFARTTAPLLRASFAAYNDESDLESLVTALERVLTDS